MGRGYESKIDSLTFFCVLFFLYLIVTALVSFWPLMIPLCVNNLMFIVINLSCCRMIADLQCNINYILHSLYNTFIELNYEWKCIPFIFVLWLLNCTLHFTAYCTRCLYWLYTVYHHHISIFWYFLLCMFVVSDVSDMYHVHNLSATEWECKDSDLFISRLVSLCGNVRVVCKYLTDYDQFSNFPDFTYFPNSVFQYFSVSFLFKCYFAMLWERDIIIFYHQCDEHIFAFWLHLRYLSISRHLELWWIVFCYDSCRRRVVLLLLVFVFIW